MDTSRRIFIRNSAIAVAGATLLPHYLSAQPKKLERLVVQLYTVRDAMHADAVGTLKKLYDAGVRHIEHADYAPGMCNCGEKNEKKYCYLMQVLIRDFYLKSLMSNKYNRIYYFFTYLEESVSPTYDAD